MIWVDASCVALMDPDNLNARGRGHTAASGRGSCPRMDTGRRQV